LSPLPCACGSSINPGNSPPRSSRGPDRGISYRFHLFLALALSQN
jgi:hypothetical protein